MGSVKISKDKNGETVPYLEIIKVILGHCNVANNSIYVNAPVLIGCHQNSRQFAHFENVIRYHPHWFQVPHLKQMCCKQKFIYLVSLLTQYLSSNDNLGITVWYQE